MAHSTGPVSFSGRNVRRHGSREASPRSKRLIIPTRTADHRRYETCAVSSHVARPLSDVSAPVVDEVPLCMRKLQPIHILLGYEDAVAMCGDQFTTLLVHDIESLSEDA